MKYWTYNDKQMIECLICIPKKVITSFLVFQRTKDFGPHSDGWLISFLFKLKDWNRISRVEPIKEYRTERISMMMMRGKSWSKNLQSEEEWRERKNTDEEHGGQRLLEITLRKMWTVRRNWLGRQSNQTS